MARGTGGLMTDAAADTLTRLASQEKAVERRVGKTGRNGVPLDVIRRAHYTAPNNRCLRGHLPPIAATLNKVLKRDAPGGFPAREILFFASLGSND